MGDAGFYRGTNADQDGRFSDKEKKLLRTMKFEDALERKINRSKINLDVIKPWVVMRLNEMLGIDDDVITEYVFTQLEEPELNPKIIQINITGFLNARRAREFMGELWSLLIEAEESEDGIPKSLIEKKLSELHSRDFAKKQTETKDNVAIKTAENDWKHRYTSLSGGVYTGPMIKRERDDRIYSDKDRERPRDDARDNVRERPRDDARDNVRERPRDDTRDNVRDRDRERDRGRDRERERERERDRDRERPRREREVRRSEERRDRGDRDREHRRDDRDKRDERRESRKEDEEKRDVKRKKRSRSRSRSRSPRRKFKEGPTDKEKKHHDNDNEKKRKKAKKEKKKSKRRSSSSSSASD